MKFNIRSGICAGSVNCKNINKPCCHVDEVKVKRKLTWFGILKYRYVECDNYDYIVEIDIQQHQQRGQNGK